MSCVGDANASVVHLTDTNSTFSFYTEGSLDLIWTPLRSPWAKAAAAQSCRTGAHSPGGQSPFSPRGEHRSALRGPWGSRGGAGTVCRGLSSTGGVGAPLARKSSGWFRPTSVLLLTFLLERCQDLCRVFPAGLPPGSPVQCPRQYRVVVAVRALPSYGGQCRPRLVQPRALARSRLGENVVVTSVIWEMLYK